MLAAGETGLGLDRRTYDEDAGPYNQRLYLNGSRVAQMSDTLPIDLNSAALGIGRHVSGIADPFNGHIDEFRIAHVQRSDGWIETTWNNISDPGAFAAAGAEEQEGGGPPPLAGAGVVVCLMGVSANGRPSVWQTQFSASRCSGSLARTILCGASVVLAAVTRGVACSPGVFGNLSPARMSRRSRAGRPRGTAAPPSRYQRAGRPWCNRQAR
jgi:hypothetical protein